MSVPGFRRSLLRVIRQVPRGKVVTYGQVAELAGVPTRARQVGYALAALPAGTAVPWHRVVNAKGRISMRRRPGPELTQRMLLQSEGVRFDAGGRISLPRYQWQPRRRARSDLGRVGPGEGIRLPTTRTRSPA